MKNKKFTSILFRYLILLVISFLGFDLFYYVFLPLTKYPVYWGLKLLYNPILLNNLILVNSKIVEISGACIAGSAYFFLLVLALSVPFTSLKKRLLVILTSFGMFFTINIIRIYLLSIMYFEGAVMFDITHKAFWYLGSTIFLVLIWFLCVHIFKISKTPFYDDIKFIYGHSSLKRKIKT